MVLADHRRLALLGAIVSIMPETASDATTFLELHTPKARLIRCTEPPEISTLTPGDMVICEDGWGVQDFITRCEAKGVHVRVGSFRYETEKVIHRRTRSGVQADYPEVLLNASHVSPPGEFATTEVVEASQAAFAITWDALSAEVAQVEYEDGAKHLPAELAEYLPYPTVNPAQAQAAPYIMGDRPVVVVAPTGAGKTVIGMMAAIKEIKQSGRKAAWLVPQRTLTAELDRELEAWRKMGVKVVSLSGEATTDAEKTKNADLWVATTEKFEALCRASSMKEAISGIGTVIVDEIHLLGEPSRGPVLESLLARIRQEGSGARLVGLSATAANANQVAQWLNADLVEITWRPTRLTNQLLTLPVTDSRAEEDEVRNETVTSLVQETAEGDGSTLVFCGSKHNVRSTALAIAASRGARGAHGTQPGDIEAVAEVCAEAGVGLHYSDWPHKKEAERQFRERETDVLVATSTLAAGVNTPARVVVVRDTSIGPQPMEVSMIQQMFGRAGRAGKESEGWSFLLVGANELGRWRQRLADGYTINSGILDSIADHLLGEVVQGNVRSQEQAERWWESTLAYHQGEQNLTPINEARDFLTRWRFLETEETSDGLMWQATRLGGVTSKMMVDVKDAASLLAAISRTPTPNGAFAAETSLFEMLVNGVYAFENAQDAPGGEQSRHLRNILMAQGIQARIGEQESNSRDKMPGREVVRAGLMLLARSPQAFASQARTVAGVSRALFNPAVYDSPRYLAWLAALGPLGSVPSWVSVVAADLGQRVAHYRLRPRRGDGRFLHAATRLSLGGPSISKLWEEARMIGGISPARWLKQTTLGGKQAPALASAVVTITEEDGTRRASRGATLFEPQKGQPHWGRVPAAKGSRSPVVAAFGSRGDWCGTGWLEEFSVSR